MIDYYQYYMHPEGPRTPAQLERCWWGALDEAARHGSTVTLIIHAIVSGIEDDKLEAIARLLEKVKADPRLEICTASEVAQRCKTKLLS